MKLKFDNDLYEKLVKMEEPCDAAGDCKYCPKRNECDEICGSCFPPYELIEKIQDLIDRKILKEV